MGQEINNEHFSEEDWRNYQQKLEQETLLLKEQVNDGLFSTHAPVGGFEIEGWLIDEHFQPTCKNDAFFNTFNDDQLASAELAKFNIELNNTPQTLKGKVFKRFENELKNTWKKATQVATEIDAHLLLTGILPTIKQSDFRTENMSDLHRYHALNEQVLSARDQRPLFLDITGKDHLQLQHESVMLEAATTSFQIHIQTPWQQAHHYYNASMLASAPVLAAATNSPYLFGKELWQETRIPLFEQAVNTGRFKASRVSFGKHFAEKSILECFEENLQQYDVLLPVIFNKPAERFSHLRLHNGVIWRWNRPLIGFDQDGTTPHFRIEHRTLPAGPTITDMVANAVFYYGLTEKLMPLSEQMQMPCNFQQTKDNFYQAAKHGLDAEITWKQKHLPIQPLIIDELLPLAEQGLQNLHIDSAEISHYLGIIADRVSKKQTGANWQIQFAKQHNHNMQALTQAYWENQQKNVPVSEWQRS
jgi:hypothetical protein